MFNHHCTGIKDFWFHCGLVFGHMKSALILFKLSLLLGMWYTNAWIGMEKIVKFMTVG